MTLLDDRRFMVGFATVVFFVGFAGDAVRNSLSWYGYGAIVVAMFATSVILLVRQREKLRFAILPLPLLAFTLLCSVSIVWSNYPGATAIAAAIQIITVTVAVSLALVVPVTALVRALGRALRAILVLSVLFELVVAVVVRAPVLPVWVSGSDRVDPPLLLYWSRNVLFEGGPIQGIVGSSSLLAMAALLALIVTAVETLAGTLGRRRGAGWMLLALVLIALTRSATIFVAMAVLVLVTALVLLVRWATSRARRIVLAGIIIMAASLVVAASTVMRTEVLGLLGKTDTLTNRTEIWNAVIGLAQQRPALGWGWISFWAPWVEPYRSLVSNNGVAQLHAHNAWLDIWVQLGVLGLIVFGTLVATTVIRAFLLSIDRIGKSPLSRGKFSIVSVLPLLLLTALLVQSMAESRLLIEGGLLLLVVAAVVTKVRMLGRSSELP